MCVRCEERDEVHWGYHGADRMHQRSFSGDVGGRTVAYLHVERRVDEAAVRDEELCADDAQKVLVFAGSRTYAYEGRQCASTGVTAMSGGDGGAPLRTYQPTSPVTPKRSQLSVILQGSGTSYLSVSCIRSTC